MSPFFISAMVKFIERIVRKAVKSSIAETCYCHLINDKFNERKLEKGLISGPNMSLFLFQQWLS